MRPFAPADRCTKVLTGHQHSYEKNLLKCAWNADGSQVRALRNPIIFRAVHL